MAMTIKTTIRNLTVNYLEADDWVDDGGCMSDWEELKECESTRTPVTIISKESDGYMNIKLPSGREVVGISAYHLDGFIDYLHNSIDYTALGR